MSRTEASGALTVYADYVCPFCYLGKASLETYLDTADEMIDVEWHPFDLRGYARGPDGEIRDGFDDGKTEAYFAGVVENVERLKDRYGVEMSIDLAREVDSWDAMQAALYVRREHGGAAFQSFHDAVFEALWVDGRDIGDPNVITDIAESVDVPAGEMREAVDDGVTEADLREQVETARRHGVTAVPTFVYGDRAARGAVPPEHFRRLIRGS